MGSGTQPQRATVSVVLPVRNGVPDIQRQLAALADQVTDRPWEPVVADNGSTDGTPAMVETWRHRLPHKPGHPPASLGCNLAYRRKIFDEPDQEGRVQAHIDLMEGLPGLTLTATAEVDEPTVENWPESGPSRPVVLSL